MDEQTSLRLELLPNGFVRVDDRASGSVGLWTQDGTPRSGDLTRVRSAAQIGRIVRYWMEAVR
jgi:hypothetical protein